MTPLPKRRFPCAHARATAVALLAGMLLVPAAPSFATEPAATRPGAYRGPRRSGFEKAFLLPIKDEINDVTLESLRRRVEAARAEGADLLIFELDTPGGVAMTALKICTLIKNLGSIHTVAWVNPDAYSAGAIIALACDDIVMNERSKIGDCQPIMITPEGVSAVPEDVDAKFTSPLIEELKDSANRGGLELTLLLSMVRPGMEIFWVENTQTGERKFVRTTERNRLFGLDEKNLPAAARAESVGDERRDKGSDAGSSERRRRFEPDHEPIPDDLSTTPWRYVKVAPPLERVRQPIVARSELLTMGQDEAIAYGIARAKISSESEMRSFFDIRGPIHRLEYTRTERVVDWLSSPLVRSLLFIIMMLAAYVAFNMPGMGLPELVALVCLLLFLGAPYLTGLANAWEIIVVVAGIGLLIVELFVVPGFGLAGLAGGLLILVGLLATFVPHDPGPIYWPEFNYTLKGVRTGLWVIALGLTASVAGMVLLSRFIPRTPYFRRFVPPNPTPESVQVTDPLEPLVGIGSVGLVEGPLRPAGKARFGSTLADVVSDGEFVNAGERVEVIERKANRVVVRRVRRSE